VALTKEDAIKYFETWELNKMEHMLISGIRASFMIDNIANLGLPRPFDNNDTIFSLFPLM
jgi:hypothetical protein